MTLRFKPFWYDFIGLLRGLVRKIQDDHVLQRAVELAGQDHVHQAYPDPSQPPLISFVVPVYNTKAAYLDDLAASFHLQLKTGVACELVLSDDGSTSRQTLKRLEKLGREEGVVVVRSAQNGGIARATNLGVEAARGQWIGLVDHDDALAPFAAERIARTLAQHPDCQFLYTDEVIADAALRPQGYFLKPAWDVVLLSGVNYVNHLSLYRRDRFLRMGGVREGFEGSQDYDLVLRYTAGLSDREILHLPYPAYLWRRDGASYSALFLEAATRHARRALGQRFGRPDADAVIDEALTPNLHRVRFDAMQTSWPKVSVIIPSIDHHELISRTLRGLCEETDYPDLEIIVVDNGTQDPQVLDLYAQYEERAPAFKAILHKEDFNFSRSINRGLEYASGDMILLLNNDVEIREPGWLKEMVSCMSYERAGIVGARLLYPSGALQHVGVMVGFGGLAGHWFVEEPGDFVGPMARLQVRQSFSAVTGACMLVSRACLEKVGRLDEQAFAIAYNDIDYCLRAREQGFRIVWTPFATLIHHESATRGSDVAPDKIERFRREQDNLRARHQTDCFEDPAINPWYSKDRSHPILVKRNALPGAR